MPTTKIDIQKLARKIFTGKVDLLHLPKEVYQFTYEQLLKALYDGYGAVWNKTVTWNEIDRALLGRLRTNVYHFSAAKTFNQISEMSAAMYDGDRVVPYSEFKLKVKEISTVYNDNWLATEYNTVLESASSAASWRRFEKEKRVLPNLRYSSIETACEICTPMNGVTLPLADPFWNSHNVPQHFNCRCILLQEEGSVQTTDTGKVEVLNKYLTEKKSPVFMNNPGKTGVVFNKKHAYFMVSRRYARFANDNFGLKIPVKDDF